MRAKELTERQLLELLEQRATALKRSATNFNRALELYSRRYGDPAGTLGLKNIRIIYDRAHTILSYTDLKTGHRKGIALSDESKIPIHMIFGIE